MSDRYRRINLDAVFKDTQLGVINKSISMTMTGMRTGHRKLITPTSKENYGFVFLTRPQLNLSSPNVHRHRPFMPLLSSNKSSIASWIRGTLDPRWAKYGDIAWGMNAIRETKSSDLSDGGLTYDTVTPIVNEHASQVDNRSPFINIISNNVVQVSGFPDIDMPVFTADPNRIGHSFQMIDGTENLNMPVDITLTVQDVTGNPIYNLFRVLSLYPGRIYANQMIKYPDFIEQDTIDYNVRLYRILLSPNGRKVVHIGSTFPGFVQGVASGSRYDFSLETPYTEDNMVSLRLMFGGVEYDDPVLIDDFNMTVMSTNEDMRPIDDNGTRPNMTKIPHHQINHFSYERVYPFIDIDTYELEWWTTTERYNRIAAEIGQFYRADKATPVINA